MENGRCAALHIVSTHKANDAGILTADDSDCIQLFLVPCVKGIIFADHANGFQKFLSFSEKSAKQGLRNLVIYYRIGLVMVIIPQSVIKENIYFTGGKSQ